MASSFDVVFLGGGMGGYVGAIRAAQLGLGTAVVEEDKLGGTCLHRGCIPTKALLQSAFVLDQARQGARLGVRVSGVELDYEQVGKNRDQVVSQLHRGVEFLMKKHRIEVVRGRGRLDGPRRIRVGGGQSGDVEIEAGAVVIATGSRPKQVPGVEPDGRSVLTSDHALTLDHVPASAIVLGAGAVGVEFASFWRSCGAEVTVVEMLDRLVPLEDRAIGAELGKHFEARGIRCLVGARLDLSSVRQMGEGISVSVAHGGKEERIAAEVLLVAIGRSPNTEGIGLETTAVELERGFVRAGADLRTAQEGVYAIGDVIGGFLLAHKGSHEGIIAAEVIAGRHPHPLDPLLVPRTTYCTPQIASLGLSEEEARQAGHEVRVGLFPLTANGRSIIWGERGFCKVVAGADGTVLGVHMIGPEVTELIYAASLGGLLEATPFEMGRAIAPHPTVSEILMEAALAASGEAIHI
ncbi:MAG: dihydrolipoyl dehydrogenase [Candidatus Dormibacteria bacterium]|jgi:dihydrolipoamide dehydrogenase